MMTMINKFSFSYLEGLLRSLSLSQIIIGWYMFLSILASGYYHCRGLVALRRGEGLKVVFRFFLKSIWALLFACTLGLFHVVVFCE